MIVNPLSGRKIQIGGKLYNKLLKDGVNFENKLKKQKSNKKEDDSIENLMQNLTLHHKPPNPTQYLQKHKEIINAKLSHDERRYFIDGNSNGVETVSKKGMKELKLPAGTIVFHGYRSEQNFETRFQSPMYFSDVDIARGYNSKNCRGFETKSTYNFLRFDDANTVRALIKHVIQVRKNPDDADVKALRVLTGVDLESLNEFPCKYTHKNPNEVRFCTEAFISPWYEQRNIYCSLQVALLVRELGYDGWYVGQNKVKRANSGNGLFHQELLFVHPSIQLKETSITCFQVKLNEQPSPQKPKEVKMFQNPQAVLAKIFHNRSLKTIEPGVLTVAAYCNFYPVCYRDDQNNITGLDVDIMKEFCRLTDLKLKFVEYPHFNNIWLAPVEGKSDVAIGGIGISKFRTKDETSWTIPYFYVKRTVVYNLEDPISSFPEGVTRTILSTKGSTGWDDAEDKLMGYEDKDDLMIPGTNDKEDIARLLSGEVQGLMRGSFVGKAIVAKYPRQLGMVTPWDINPLLVSSDGEVFAYPTNIRSGISVLLSVLVTEDIMSNELQHLIDKYHLN